MKKVLLFLSILLITGCQVNYSIDFEDDLLKENINIVVPKNSDGIEELKSKKPYSINTFNNKALYKVTHKEHFKDFEANYSYNYNVNNFILASQPASCFNAFSFARNDRGYILSTSKGFKCLNVDFHTVDNVKIEIKTNHIVLEHNADSVEKDKYIWNINKDNAKDTSILIRFGEVKKKNLFEKIIDYIKKNKVIFIILGIFFGGILISVFYIINKAKINNDI